MDQTQTKNIHELLDQNKVTNDFGKLKADFSTMVDQLAIEHEIVNEFKIDLIDDMMTLLHRSVDQTTTDFKNDCFECLGDILNGYCEMKISTECGDSYDYSDIKLSYDDYVSIINMLKTIKNVLVEKEACDWMISNTITIETETFKFVVDLGGDQGDPSLNVILYLNGERHSGKVVDLLNQIKHDEDQKILLMSVIIMFKKSWDRVDPF